MVKEKYKDIPDTEFVPLKEGIDPVFWGKYEINKNSLIIKHRSGIDPEGWCAVFFTKAGLIERGLDSENDILVGGFINQNTGEFRWHNPERFKPDEYVDIFGFREEIELKGWVLYSYNDDRKKCKLKVLGKDGKYREIENPGYINGEGYLVITIRLPNGKRIYFKKQLSDIRNI